MALPVSPTVAAELARFFTRNGYVRRQNQRRLDEEGYMRYKKGDEVRLVAENRGELARIRSLLLRAGFRPGSPFVKGRQFRQPVYGRGEVRRFLGLVADQLAAPRRVQRRGRKAPRRGVGPRGRA
jgi:hypothetical protein